MNRLRLIQAVTSIFCVLIVFWSQHGRAEASSPFSDVNMYSSQINFLYNQGIIKGYSNGTFHPNSLVKRLQAVQMILKQLGITNFSAPKVNFTDLKPGDYGYDQVAKAVQLGIIKGKKDGSFDPWGDLTRAQMAVIMTKAYQLKVEQPERFKDVSNSFWAGSSISALVSNGIANGYPNNTFRPNQNIQRNHFSVFLSNYIHQYQTLSVNNDLKGLVSKEQSVVMVIGNDSSGTPIQEGSGFFVGKGLILTNYHVLQGAKSVDIMTNDGKKYRADGVVKYDRKHDLAILKVSAPIMAPALQLGSEQTATQGDPVVTIGSPEGLMNTVSEGIVSGLRTMTDSNGNSEDLIQITAPITHGSSGGPLLDMNGYVLGVNSYGYGAGNLNFAIPIDYAKPWVSSLSHLSLSQIKTVPVSDLSLPPNLIGKIADAATASAPSIKETPIMTLDQPIENVVADPNSSVIYATYFYRYAPQKSRDVVKINYDTKQEIKMAFNNFKPYSLYLKKQHLYVSLHSALYDGYQTNKIPPGAIATINTNNFSLRNKFTTKILPGDLVVDESHVYVISALGPTGNGVWGKFNSYNPVTGTLTDSMGNVLTSQNLQINPREDQIFTNTMEMFKITKGHFLETYDEPLDSPVYPLKGEMKLSPDGNYLFNGSGEIFYAAENKETDMTHVGKLAYPWDYIAFDLSNHVIYAYNNQSLYVYNYNTFKLIGKYPIKNGIHKLFVHNGQLYALASDYINDNPYFIEKINF